MPLVSIVIPVFNPGPYLRRALDSVASQTYRDWQIVVVDDGSAEQVQAVCESFPSLTYVRTERHGVSAARNLGISKSDSKYVAFLDGDDLWHPQKLRIQVEQMAQSGLYFSHTANRIIGSDDQLTDNLGPLLPFDCPADDLSARFHTELASSFGHRDVTTSSVILNREVFDKVGMFDAAMPLAEDMHLWLRASLLGPLLYIDLPLTLYRKHEGNASGSRYLDGYAAKRSLTDRLESLASENADLSLAIQGVIERGRILCAYEAYNCSRSCVRAGDFAGAITHLYHAFRLEPKHVIDGFIAAARKRIKIG